MAVQDTGRMMPSEAEKESRSGRLKAMGWGPFLIILGRDLLAQCEAD
jgi:hypothetical protein